MSAYICDRDHIVYLIEAALSHEIGRSGGGTFSWYHRGAPNSADRHKQLGGGEYERAAEIANMLWMENIKSVSHRYPGESSATLPGPIDENFVIEPGDFRVFRRIRPIQVLKACKCYAYQSCEHPEWEQSEAYAFIESLKESAIASLPGYEDAEWGAPAGKAVA